jgi:hypothetical protein
MLGEGPFDGGIVGFVVDCRVGLFVGFVVGLLVGGCVVVCVGVTVGLGIGEENTVGLGVEVGSIVGDGNGVGIIVAVQSAVMTLGPSTKTVVEGSNELTAPFQPLNTIVRAGLILTFVSLIETDAFDPWSYHPEP